MGDPRGFLKTKRQEAGYRPVCERIKDYNPAAVLHSEEDAKQQASRCMDCATPFCHWGCPIGNYIPEWNDFAFKGNWKEAFELLEITNNFPEITGRVCPAPCEYSCVLGINDDAVTIRENELAIIENAFKKGLVMPKLPKIRTGKKIAVIGSGPAGLAAAMQLNRVGHTVFVFEKDEKIGGILRYGIPDFKLEKSILDRRIKILEKEGIKFKTSVNVGIDYPAEKLLKDFDAICLAGGCRTPRDLSIEGRQLKGIYFAMDYLIQSNKKVAGEKILKTELIDAKGKRIVVIGGGDTGSDCVGTANRQGAACVTQIELLAKPAECRSEDCPWPHYPFLLKTSSSHKEGTERLWTIQTKKFIGKNGRVKKLYCQAPDSAFEIEADLVILAMGFIHPQRAGLLEDLNVKFNNKGNVETNENYMTSVDKVFCAGDMKRGQSLVVWAISEGRSCAYNIDKYLMQESCLPRI
ncbi:MAG: glutamate synthase subunit beta [Candidatus Omnitrophota bacterium]